MFFKLIDSFSWTEYIYHMFFTVHRSSRIMLKFSEKSVRNARKMKITPACPRFPEPGNVEVSRGLVAEEPWLGSFPCLLCRGSPLWLRHPNRHTHSLPTEYFLFLLCVTLWIKCI